MTRLPPLALATLLCFPGEPACVKASDILATYEGGSVTQEELQDWRKACPKTLGSEKTEKDLEAIAMAKFLSEEHKASGSTLAHLLSIRGIRAKHLHREWNAELLRKIELPKNLLQKELNLNRRKFQSPAKVRIRNLFKNTEGKPESEVEAVREKMHSIRDRVKAGENFATLAKSESDSINRPDGGLVGNIPRGKFPPALDEMVFKMRKGEITPVLTVEGGLTILYCENIFPAVQRTDEEILTKLQPRLIQGLFQEKLTRTREKWIASIQIDLPALQGSELNAIALTALHEISLSVAEVDELMTSVAGGKIARDKLTEPLVLKWVTPYVLDLIAAAEFLSANSLPAGLEKKIEWEVTNLRAKEAFAARLDQAREVEEPTEAEMRKLYDQIGDTLNSKPEYEAEWISIVTGPETLSVDQAVLVKLRMALLEDGEKSLTDLGTALTANISDRVSTGARSWRSSTAMSSLGAIPGRVLKELEDGELSRIFRTISRPKRLWLIKRYQFRPSHPLTFSEARRGLHQFILQEKEKERERITEKNLLEEMKFKIAENAD